MSIRIMSEVWRTDLPTSEKMVLLVIADHASDEGDNAWPSQKTIADRASLSIRTVQRVVHALIAGGYLHMEKGAGGSANCREDRRPHRYTIHLGKIRADKVSGRAVRGDIDDSNGATSTTNTGRHLRPMNHPLEPSLESSNSFDEFWKIYPRKTAKGAAKKAWAKIKNAEPVIEGAKRYAADPNRDPVFTPHPATWLNGERWLDEPLPPRRPANAPRSVDTTPTPQPPRFSADELPKGVPMPDSLKEILRRV
jgi:Helix-turn-helix domain